MFRAAEWQEGASTSCTPWYVRCHKKWSKMLAQRGRMHLKYEIFPAGGYRGERSRSYSVRGEETVVISRQSMSCCGVRDAYVTRACPDCVLFPPLTFRERSTANATSRYIPVHCSQSFILSFLSFLTLPTRPQYPTHTEIPHCASQFSKCSDSQRPGWLWASHWSFGGLSKLVAQGMKTELRKMEPDIRSDSPEALRPACRL